MTPTDSRLLLRIEAIRGENNIAWMDVLRLALRVAPKPTRVLLRRIAANDRLIRRYLARLAR